jgi:hypothetical protein
MDGRVSVLRVGEVKWTKEVVLLQMTRTGTKIWDASGE